MAHCSFLELSCQASAHQVAQGFTIAYLLQRHRHQKQVETGAAEAEALSTPDGVPSKSKPSMPESPVLMKAAPPRPSYPFKAHPSTPPSPDATPIDQIKAIPFKALPSGVVPPPQPVFQCPRVLYKLPSSDELHQTTACFRIKNTVALQTLLPCRHCCNV